MAYAGLHPNWCRCTSCKMEGKQVIRVTLSFRDLDNTTETGLCNTLIQKGMPLSITDNKIKPTRGEFQWEDRGTNRTFTWIGERTVDPGDILNPLIPLDTVFEEALKEGLSKLGSQTENFKKKKSTFEEEDPQRSIDLKHQD